MKADIDATLKELEQGVKDIFESGRYAEYLAFMARFHQYSACNCVLIFRQMPDAQLVAGFNSWKKDFNRSVKKGERGIRILAPRSHKITKHVEDEKGNVEVKEIRWTTFHPVAVFDVSQTEGDEIPSLVSDLSGDVAGYDRLLESLRKLSPVPICFESIAGTAKGFFDPAAGRIVINAGMPEAQKLKTLVHEISHAILHCKGGDEEEADRRTKEVQAESVAYTVCQVLGLDTGDYSFGYVAGWSRGKDLKELQASMEIIRKTADGILEGLRAA